MLKIPAQNYPIIEKWITKQSRVLDLGCGDGTLLHSLIQSKQVQAIGVEISQDMIIQCIKKGISIYQADIDKDLSQWDNNSFDYVILNSTLQVITKPYRVIDEMLRVGKYAIISVSNFGYIKNRLSVMLQGRVSNRMRGSESWHDSPVIRFVSLKEFRTSLKSMGIEIMDACFFLPYNITTITNWPLNNFFAKEGIFKLMRGT